MRFQHIKWQPEKTNLADWIISEGLAESLTEHLFGAEYLGAWVTATNTTQLQTLKPVFHEKLALTGMQKMMPYLYGDEIAALQGQEPVGLPYAAGYACGYHLVQHYLKKPDKTSCRQPSRRLRTSSPPQQISGTKRRL